MLSIRKQEAHTSNVRWRLRTGEFYRRIRSWKFSYIPEYKLSITMLQFVCVWVLFAWEWTARENEGPLIYFSILTRLSNRCSNDRVVTPNYLIFIGKKWSQEAGRPKISKKGRSRTCCIWKLFMRSPDCWLAILYCSCARSKVAMHAIYGKLSRQFIPCVKHNFTCIHVPSWRQQSCACGVSLIHIKRLNTKNSSTWIQQIRR